MGMMYAPVPDGFSVRGSAVRYTEVPAGDALSDVVHCFWELKTVTTLAEDFLYHALPDACVNVLFNRMDTRIAGITALRTKATTLNLGTAFHYVGVQLYPGAWQGDPREISDRYVGSPYEGALPLVAWGRRLEGLALPEMAPILSDLLRWCIDHGHARASAETACILRNIDRVRSVADMATLLGLSPRQVQRTLRRLTGFAPHDLLKVLRLQQSFRMHHLDLYADQAHYSNSFRRSVGCTPLQYRRRFGV
jgi:AraC-like DNA-binding protein